MEESSALWQSSGGSSILRPANRFVPLIHAKRAIGYKGEGFSYTARARRRALTYHLDVIIWQYCISGDSRVGDFLSGTPGNNHTLSRSHSHHSSYVNNVRQLDDLEAWLDVLLENHEEY